MAQQAIITTDELEIYRQADSYLVRQKLRNRFIRMGERELRNTLENMVVLSNNEYLQLDGTDQEGTGGRV